MLDITAQFILFFNFDKHMSPVFTRHIWLYSKGNYQSFSNELRETNWDALKNNDIDIYAANVTEQIMKLANQYIPNKTIKVRKSDPAWLTNSIKRLMRKKNVYMINLGNQIVPEILRNIST